MEQEKIEKLAESFVLEGLASGEAQAAAKNEIVLLEQDSSRMLTADVIALCRAVARVGAGAAKDGTSENALYDGYLMAFYVQRTGHVINVNETRFFAVHAAIVLGQIDAQAGNKLKTRGAVIAAIDALFDGDAPRVMEESPSTPAPAA